jgi:hypothetical protein
VTTDVIGTRRKKTASLRNEATVRRNPSEPRNSYLWFVITDMAAKATRASFYMSVRGRTDDGRGAKWHSGRTDEFFHGSAQFISCHISRR